MKKCLNNLKRNQLKVKQPIIGEFNSNKTFLLNPKWLEKWEKEEENGFSTIKS